MSLVLLMPFLAGGATAQPPSNLDRVRSIAFLNASTGLITYTDLPQSTYRFTKDSTRLIPGLNGARSLAVQDEDVAWCTIDRGLYRGDRAWTRWTLIDTEQAHLLVGCANGQLFFMSNGSLFSATAAGVTMDTGLMTNDAIAQIDYQSSRAIYGLGGYGIYRSTDGGHDWSLFYPTSAQGLYVDRVHHRIYVGGPLRVSTDEGATWREIPSETEYPFIPLYGTVSGAHDCTGAFYVAPSGNTTDAYRFGEDGFFHNVGPVMIGGPVPPGTLGIPGTLQVFDGGAIAYALADRYVTFTGIGGDLTDSARTQLTATSETLNADLCSAGRDSIRLSIRSRTCLPISIDSVRAITSVGSVTPLAKVNRVIEGSTTTLALAYKPQSPGADTVTLTVFVHNVEGRGYRESIDVRSTVTVQGALPALGVRPSYDFGSVETQGTSKRTIAIRNTGCMALRVDSVVSSHSSLFSVEQRTFPISIAHGDSVTWTVTYRPTAPGDDLESLEIGTNAGHRYVTLTGHATKLGVAEDEATAGFSASYSSSERSLRVLASGAGRLDLYSTLGERIGTWDIAASNAPSITLSTGSLAPGMYVLRFTGVSPEAGEPQFIRIVVP